MRQPTVIVDDEFKSLIPPLSDEEYEGLERSIVIEGVRDPLVVWAGHDILIDGHNRLKIAQKHNVPYKITEKEFETRSEVEVWMLLNQLNRRNLSDYNRIVVANKLSDSIARRAKEQKARAAEKARECRWEKQADNSLLLPNLATTENKSSLVNDIRRDGTESTETTNPVVQNDQSKPEDVRQKSPYEADIPIEVVHVPEEAKPVESAKSVHTRVEVAKVAGVAPEQVRRVGKIEKNATEEIKGLARDDKMTIAAAYDASRMKPERQREIAKRISMGEKPKKVMREARREEHEEEAVRRIPEHDTVGSAKLIEGSGIGKTVECDMLMTETPSKADPTHFVDEWLYSALCGVKDTGFAYIFIDGNLETLKAYLDAELPDDINLCQVLTWKFTYLLGNDNRNVYKPDCKYILFYRGVNAPVLKHLYSDEWTSVHVMDADGGSLADPDYELRFPIKLAARFIQHSTSEGQTIYDPFARYGTILLAAKKLGRDAVGYESDAKMAEKAYERGIERK